MARMINSTHTTNIGIVISTFFEDGTAHSKEYAIGDVIENLRYVMNGEIEVVTGRLSAVNYTVKRPTKWNPDNPVDIDLELLAEDMQLTSIIVDASTEYFSNRVNVPVREIVEFEEETNVKRVKVVPTLNVEMTLKYSDHTISYADIDAGDNFNNVKFLIPEQMTEKTGHFKVVGFAYEPETANKMNVYGLVMKSVETDDVYVVDFSNILSLTEVSEYEVPDMDAMVEVINNLTDFDIVTVSAPLDLSAGNGIELNKKNVELALEKNLTTDGSNSGGIKVTGTAELSGKGRVVTTTPYDSTHSSGVIQVNGDGELTFTASGIKAVIADDPVNKGQFGVCIYDNAKLNIYGGEFEAGWYCVSGNGSKTSANAVTTIRGGRMESYADYAIYHPHAGKLVITGGEIVGGAGAIAANAGSIEISGGKFKCSGGGDTGSWSDGTGGLGEAVINLNARYGDVTCLITGGEFSVPELNTTIKLFNVNTTAHNVTLKILGGKFNRKPDAAYIPEGYKCSDSTDSFGFYEVTADPDHWVG